MSLIWDFQVDLQGLEKDFYQKFHEKVNITSDNVFKILECGFQTHKLTSKDNKNQNSDIDLKSLIERNKLLRSEIDNKLEDLKKNQSQYDNYKKDRKLLAQEVKETYEAFLMGKKYYKKFLKIYYTIEATTDINQIVFVQFFTESKKDTDIYSVRLSRDMKSRHYEIIDMTPKLKNLGDIQKKLAATNDVPGALCFIRQKFLKLKQNK